MLLHRATRASLGVDVKDCVLIFDEAHNIVEAMNSAYSCTLSLGTAAVLPRLRFVVGELDLVRPCVL